jgi:hypothetical protein
MQGWGDLQNFSKRHENDLDLADMVLNAHGPGRIVGQTHVEQYALRGRGGK